jgi:hypothetical protein
MRKNKIIYVDESGQNFKFGHSTYAFVYVEVEDNVDFEKQVQQIELDLKIHKAHWRDMSWKVRERFADRISSLDFTANVVVFKDSKDTSKSLGEAFKYAVLENDFKKIIVDGEKSEKYGRVIKNVMRQRNLSTKDVDFRNDEKFAGLRIADFIAGLSRAYYENLGNEFAKRIFEKISKKIRVITVNF